PFSRWRIFFFPARLQYAPPRPSYIPTPRKPFFPQTKKMLPHLLSQTGEQLSQSIKLLQNFSALAQPLDRRQVLGAGPFTLAAADAVRRLAPAFHRPGVGLPGLVGLVAGQLLVGGGKDLGDEDLAGAAVHAVAAAGA